jgi:hypothetical protein
MIFKHIDGVSVKAVFMKENGTLFRYKLTISKKGISEGGKTVCAIMQNPSVAGIEFADKSVQFLEKVIFTKGLKEFKGVIRLVIVNQFAKIQTNHFSGLTNEIGKKNDTCIKQALSDASIILIGWGKSKRHLERIEFVLRLVNDMSGKKIYVTKKHPSRGCYKGFILPYRAKRKIE